MENQERLDLVEESKNSKNKRIVDILDRKDYFMGKISEYQSSQLSNKRTSFGQEDQSKAVHGSDMSVCVRVRPVLAHEKQAGLFSTVLADNPKVHLVEPKFDVKGNPKLQSSLFDVDYAFGPDHVTKQLYDCVAGPVVDLALKGGVCTVFAYGQTGSGKTWTITGLLDLLSQDIVSKCQEGNIELTLSLFELLGNNATDLLGQKSKLEIMEDKFGHVNVVGLHQEMIYSSEQLIGVTQQGMCHRKTAVTFKNDTSSRSHAIFSLTMKFKDFPEAENGKIFVVDLAGSENAADIQFHDRSRLVETKCINQSLMALKDCIRNRALSAINVDKFYHVPYRMSKLTLLLKDAFEVESHRLCKTVVIANVSPTVIDAAMTANTLRYVAPLKIGQANRKKLKKNPENPANWTNETLRNWVKSQTRFGVDEQILCPFESGMQILRLPEVEFIQRVLKGNKKLDEKKAKVFYTKLWKIFVDARTADRKQKLKPKINHKRRMEEQDEAMM